MDQNQQSLQCKVCQKVTLADGAEVWVCKECGAEHQPGEVSALDQTMQAEVNVAASQIPTATAAEPVTVAPTAPAAPMAPAAPTVAATPVSTTPSDQPSQ